MVRELITKPFAGRSGCQVFLAGDGPSATVADSTNLQKILMFGLK
ncbi:Unknown protein sequence [Pseudomonas savastanoi pv. glycinea]|uniref:Uncharacterized protein n=5 Tax=Pseudomonas syringae group TaxID=136849 RepID=A0A3M6HEB4_PSEAJ|nr:Unknown protein sequence [Pseudomonas savastanoi pv. phaseolicola]KPB59767.1 Unknown protein sequence [Pseudomonas amygdali pv. myricae]KPB67936.1 Unknown protein sequence [Pseudomonas amygdali pv. mellea]KPC29155.1 Unknown protein sequence [Pseudomonas savastanoi pv. glycinea]KPC58263.1 Unknown protein sequence [Pseudomonas amygdali pv. morsprunorum]KPW49939.1 hypothetical protein ALO82_101708 [Pseudomonas syringae pv. broussonetiae]KPW92346.1 hypothetical protein ALO50_102054 [Pseudomona